MLSVLSFGLLNDFIAIKAPLHTHTHTHTLADKVDFPCFSFYRYDCDKVWAAFEQAYVGLDPCKVPMEAYNPFIALTLEHLSPVCNKVIVTVAYELLWK